jgi:chromosome segregation ATPase|tara:strand:- start:248 stop:448 length:201 start_codon:yes stop_codon:yes gene_type:complete
MDKSVSLEELEAKREELAGTNKALADNYQKLQAEMQNVEKQIHMINGALNVVELILREKQEVKDEV